MAIIAARKTEIHTKQNNVLIVSEWMWDGSGNLGLCIFVLWQMILNFLMKFFVIFHLFFIFKIESIRKNFYYLLVFTFAFCD